MARAVMRPAPLLRHRARALSSVATAAESPLAAPPPALPPADEFERLTPVEHVLRRPGMYIGSTSQQIEPIWLYDEFTRQMVFKEARYIPGLYKIFDEILVNALDNRQRDPLTDAIDVSIEPKSGTISVTNNGAGIPVRRHATEDVWVPEMVLGSLYTGSNFDDAQQRTVGGRHGFGAKLTNLFSSEFAVSTADEQAGKVFTQRWASNMSERHEPVVADLQPGTPLQTTVRFTPDFARFGVSGLSPDMLAIFRRRVYEAAATAAPARVTLDGRRLKVEGMRDLAHMFVGRRLRGRELALAHAGPRWQVGVCLSPGGGFQQLSYVNGVATSRGGTHVSHVASQLLEQLVPTMARRLKLPPGELTAARVKPHLMLFVDCKVNNPEFDSQSKETLTSPPDAFGTSADAHRGLFRVPESLVEAAARLPGLGELLLAERGRKQDTMLRRQLASRAGAAHNLDIPKLEDAELAGGPRSSECTLILTEGDSAKALAVAGLEVVGRQTYGVFPLRGKPLNVRDASVAKLVNNKELMDLMRALGLRTDRTYAEAGGEAGGGAAAATKRKGKRGQKREEGGAAAGRPRTAERMRYGKLMLMADQDHDGSHIKGLVISMVHHFWPELLLSDFVQEFHTPLLRARRLGAAAGSGGGGGALSFYSQRDYEAWMASLTPAEQRRWRAKYYKGLGTSTAHEAREYFGDLPKHKVQLEWGGEADGDKIDMAFSRARVDDRKVWIREASRGLAEASERDAAAAQALVAAGGAVAAKGRRRRHATQQAAAAAAAAAALQSAPPALRTFGEFVSDELVHFSIADLRRSLPSAIDGLKPTQRKVLHSCFRRRLLGTAAEMKVASLAGYCSDVTAYHHGEASLHTAIINLAQDFVGSNNVPLLESCGQFGTRAEGGADAASPRYIFTKLAPITPLLYPEADQPILAYETEDGQQIEPAHYVPVVPTLLLNGSNGIGTGWSTLCWGYHPLEVIDNVLAYAEGRPMSELQPWAAGFEGGIEVEAGAALEAEGALEGGEPHEAEARAVEDAARPRAPPRRFVSRGRVQVSDAGEIVISELPLGVWTSSYKRWLGRAAKEAKEETAAVAASTDEAAGRNWSISDVWRADQLLTERHTQTRVEFVLQPTERLLAAVAAGEAPPLAEIFRLEAPHSLRNAHAFDSSGQLVHLGCAHEVIAMHAEARLDAYARRKQHELDELGGSLRLLEAKARFVSMVCEGELPLISSGGRLSSQAGVVAALEEAGFEPSLDLPRAGQPQLTAGDVVTDVVTPAGQPQLTAGAGDAAAGAAGAASRSYDYLLRMPLVTLTGERQARLEERIASSRDQIAALQATSELDLWRRELHELRGAMQQYLEARGGQPDAGGAAPPKKPRAPRGGRRQAT